MIMLNFKQPKLRDIIKAPAAIAKTRKALIQLYRQKRQLLTDDPHWAHNDAALAEFGASYTRLFMDKLWESFNEAETIGDSELLAHLWLQVTQQEHGTAIHVNYADDQGANHLLFTIDQAMQTNAHLTAHHLPQLADLNAEKPHYLLTDQMFPALLKMINLLYEADLRFLSPQETILQPVNGLHFNIQFPETKTMTSTLKVSNNVATPVKINLEINHYAVRHYQVTDESDNDVTDLGKTNLSNQGTFSWQAKHLPELTNQTLTLTVEAVAIDALPCLDDLFVLASSHNILMRAGKDSGHYQLELTNKQALGLDVDSVAETLTLQYPDENTQIYELCKTYPFLGQWLEKTLATASKK